MKKLYYLPSFFCLLFSRFEAIPFKYNSSNLIGQLNADLLLFHGSKDWIVAPEHSRELYELAIEGNYKECHLTATLVEVPDADHNRVFQHPLWEFHISKLIELNENEENSSMQCKLRASA